jgi:hypothetical protein
MCFQGSQAGWRPYQWLVTIETEAIANQFRYKDSKLAPLVKARISYARADGSDTANYEKLWFCSGRAYGLERLGPLNIDPGQGVAIRVVHQSTNPTEYDCQAAANSVIRMLLDLRINRDSLQLVVVPDESFAGITEQLFAEHFEVFRPPLLAPSQIAGALYIQDESNRHTETLHYIPNGNGY